MRQAKVFQDLTGPEADVVCLRVLCKVRPENHLPWRDGYFSMMMFGTLNLVSMLDKTIPTGPHPTMQTWVSRVFASFCENCFVEVTPLTFIILI